MIWALFNGLVIKLAQALGDDVAPQAFDDLAETDPELNQQLIGDMTVAALEKLDLADPEICTPDQLATLIRNSAHQIQRSYHPELMATLTQSPRVIRHRLQYQKFRQAMADLHQLVAIAVNRQENALDEPAEEELCVQVISGLFLPQNENRRRIRNDYYLEPILALANSGSAAAREFLSEHPETAELIKQLDQIDRIDR